MARLAEICTCCVSDGVPRRSFVVAVIVGTILNLINQGDALFHGTGVSVTKILLTYAVPYCVATYGAASFRLAAAKHRAAEETATR
ncbi:MAG: nitrate/nitrite transporter NrtS [Stellaceae bacterium]